MGDLVRLVPEPAYVLEDLVEIDLLLGLGVGIVVAEVAVTLVVLGVPKVDRNCLRVANLPRGRSWLSACGGSGRVASPGWRVVLTCRNPLGSGGKRV